ncbi:hypothetical protein L2E82_13312 [Cichorium intybus]|uniref:Uncharacterized protein n=1 Tax=Cichorium intybus TaxID=13427 RepID=A0ACB9EWW3_CICIN|nr:hypothetical protein L2E82_13312 [Cichorium intybus]
MDKHGKSGSFIGRHRWRTTMDSPRSSFSSQKLPRKSSPVPDLSQLSDSNDDLDESIPDVDHEQILLEIERFTDELSMVDDKTSPPEVPDVIETFSLIIKSKTRKSTRFAARNGEVTDEDTFLYESVRLLWKLKTALGEFPDTSTLDRVNKLLHRTIMCMEEELRALLLNSKAKLPPEPSLRAMSSRHFSFRERSPTPEPSTDEEFPGISEEKMIRINKILTTMISVGYKNECSHVYSMARGNALYEQLKKLDFEKLNAEDVQRLNWELLEADISRWIRIIKHCSDVLIPAERKLGETVFADHLSVFRGLFINLVCSVITSLLDYARTVAQTAKRSAEKMFRFLDMYEALYSLREVVKDSDSSETKEEQSCNDLNKEISSVNDKIGEAALAMFGDLENSIRNDAAKTPVPGGAVHPLIRYVLNYVKYACDYEDTLEKIFKQQAKPNHPTSPEDMEKSALAAQVISVMGVLDGNLALKAALYKDPSLRSFFLMNNGRYLLTKVRESNEIKELLGDNWCRRRSSEVRHYHKSYQRETWTRLLQCITQEGIQVNGKVNKQVLKERFKNFNAMFDEIHKTQSTWVVREAQLLSELRASISAVVIPAYRSFVGRYKHHFEPGKSVKYIKYQPEDIEALIETLFDGYNNASMSRKRF